MQRGPVHERRNRSTHPAGTADRRVLDAVHPQPLPQDESPLQSSGARLFDCLSGLWCCPLGHGHPKIAEAVAKQVKELDYSPAFQMGHPKIFSLAERLVELAPKGMGQVFFANSGSEAVDSALKIAVAYHRMKGEAARTRLIGRERGYHGVGFGGTSVGGIVGNRKLFGTLL